MPYIPILDLAISAFTMFDEAGVDNGMIPIYRSHLDNWKVTDRDLGDCSEKIPPDCFPVRPFPWRMSLGDALQELPEEVRRNFLSIHDDPDEFPQDLRLPAVILYPDLSMFGQSVSAAIIT